MKYYLNGFPKAGLHLLDALVKPLTLNETSWWAGTHANNSWTMQRIGIDQMCNSICYTPDNHRVIGHCCYDEDIEWYLDLSAIVHIFIWRDLRDVAVSQAHHIMSDDNRRFIHPAKDLYRALGGFEDVLDAVWRGIDKFPGVKERWAEYEPWLDRPNVLVIKYEDAIVDLEGVADRILDYSLSIKPRRALPDDRTVVESLHVVTNATEMAASARDTSKSPTFRRGIRGEWIQYKHIFRRSYERI